MNSPQTPEKEFSIDADFTLELLEDTPTPDQVEALLDLAHAAEQSDGNPPFSEQTLVELRKSSATHSSASTSSLHIAYAWTTDQSVHESFDSSADSKPSAGTETQTQTQPQRLLVGAGIVISAGGDNAADDARDGIGDADNTGSTDVLELVVRPSFRQQGIAGELAELLADGPLAPSASTLQRAWSHGEHEAAHRLAERFQWAPVRELWRMRLTTLDDVPTSALPDGVAIREFVPGQDEEAWLSVNAAAFATHPEQGRLTLVDLEERMSEEWFDPQGFLLAVEQTDSAEGVTEKIAGFHWTKVHPPTEPENGQGEGSESLGEVYVVGVSPDSQGRGLGRSLTLAGIDYLKSQGLSAIMLYVDADNTPAVELYKKLGFTRWDVDTMFGPTVEPTVEPA